MQEHPAMPPTPSLGKFLLQDRVLTSEQLASALRQQVIFGGRLGTNLLELGFADHDQIAAALAKLHGVPAALRRHIRSADRRARTMIPSRLCIQLDALPLAFATAGGRKLVVCMRDPTDTDAVGSIEHASHLPVVPAACPERTLYRLLAKYCDAPLPARMTGGDHKLATPFPAGHSGKFDAVTSKDLAEARGMAPRAAPTLSLVELDHEAARRDPTQVAGEEPLSLTQLADRLRHKRASEVPPTEPSPPTPTQPAPRRRRAASSLSEALLLATTENRIEAVLSRPVPAGPAALGVADALRQIEAASERVQVSDAVIGYLKSRFDAGVVLVVRDDVAYGYRGFGGHFDNSTVESILIPLSATSPFQVAHQQRSRYLGAGGGDARSLFGRFLRLFPIARRPELCVVEPVEIGDRVVCLIYAHAMGEAKLADNAFDELGTVADAVGEAFLRLIRSQRE